MAGMRATMASTSAATLIERLGALPVEHGRCLMGLSMKDVFEQVRDSALAAARQKQNESSSKSQNLLRAYCKVRLAVEELEQVAEKYGLTPRQLAAPGPQMPDDANCLALQMNPETMETAIVPVTPMAPCSSTSLKAQSLRKIRTTKDGHFRPLALRSSPSPTVARPGAEIEQNGVFGCGLAWVLEDLSLRAATIIGWIVHGMPLCVHAFWLFALCTILYLLSRPQLLVRGVIYCTEHVFRIATSSGSELLLELDKALLESSSQAMTAVVEAADPIAWAQRTLFVQPDPITLLEKAVSDRLDLEGNSSHAEIAKVAARIAVEEAKRQVSTSSSKVQANADSGSGILMGVFLALSAAKAGKFLL